MKEGSKKYVSLKIADTQDEVQLDASGSCDVSAAGVCAVLHESEPRYLLIGGKQRVFIYSCPDNSARQLRMLYSTSKASVATQLKKNGRAAGVSMEVADPEDVTDDALKGKRPSATAPPPKQAKATTAPKGVVPTKQEGGLAMFMANQLGAKGR